MKMKDTQMINGQLKNKKLYHKEDDFYIDPNNFLLTDNERISMESRDGF